MNNPRKLTLAAITALGLGLMSTVALTAPGGGGWGDPGCDYGAKAGRGGKHKAEMQAHWQERMEALHTKLNLNADQEKLWQAFTAAQTAQQETMAKHWQDMAKTKNKFPDHLKYRVQFMEDRLEGMKAMAQKGEELYNSLNAEQKTAMDNFLADRPRRPAPPAE